MNLEITGKLLTLLPETTGQGKNGTWTKRDFVIETTTEQYPKKVCISAWGDKADGLRNVNIGDEIKVQFNIESREYNERWYTDIRAWRIERSAAAVGHAADQPPYEPQKEAGWEKFNGAPTDDLPF
jgi:hypothetical protein